ncbi:Hypothetical protein FSTVST1_81 [Faustovirus ST1]|nr:Hypothetical protein FSTVST1_81 [Faustovirus ST1]
MAFKYVKQDNKMVKIVEAGEKTVIIKWVMHGEEHGRIEIKGLVSPSSLGENMNDINDYVGAYEYDIDLATAMMAAVVNHDDRNALMFVKLFHESILHHNFNCDSFVLTFTTTLNSQYKMVYTSSSTHKHNNVKMEVITTDLLTLVKLITY